MRDDTLIRLLGIAIVAWAAAPAKWKRQRHLRLDVRSVMDLCLYVPGTVVDFPAMHSAITCLFASESPSDELRYWVAVYEGLKKCRP